MLKKAAFYKLFFWVAWSLVFSGLTNPVIAQADRNSKTASRPNIILILTDDQGIGDIGYLGNPHIETPNLDRLASNGTRFNNFYVSPVCAPTRASIMTGKYSERTGVYDTYNGGAIMASSERTIAEVLSDNGYRTGIIGKWHLGDNYPFRPMDQGFSESLVFKSGGIGQPGDVYNYFEGDSSYFDPVLHHKGTPVHTEGYCSDVFTDAAIDYIKSGKKDKPFFLYLSYNAPHRPLQLPEKYYNMYRDLTMKDYNFANGGAGINKMTKKDLDNARKVYGMVTNIDDNVGRLMKAVGKENMEKNTIVIFLSDNGPAHNRFRLGLKGKKSSVYEGGVKVPFFMYGPGMLPENKEINQTAAHIDLLPTILDFLYLNSGIPQDIDGKSLKPLIQSGSIPSQFHSRTIFTEWGRGFPVPFQNFSARQGDYKLVGNTGYRNKINDFELYNITEDPAESNNVVYSNVDTARSLKKKMEKWYQSIVNNENNRKAHRIQIGSRHENPVILNRNDALGQPQIWTNDEPYGYWNVEVKKAGLYDIKFKFLNTLEDKGTLHFKTDPLHYTLSNSQTGISELTMKDVPLHIGEFELEAYYQSPTYRNLMPLYIELEKVEQKL